MEARFERAGPNTTKTNSATPAGATANKENTVGGAAQHQKKIRAKEDQFNFHDDDLFIYNHSIEEIERRLFGIVRQNNLEQEITAKDFIPIRTGTGMKFMKNGPKHIMDAEDLEPLYTPQENILEECLRREAERVAHQENLMNRVVFDSVDAAPTKPDGDDGAQEETKGGSGTNEGELEDGTTKQTSAGVDAGDSSNPSECDNDSILTPYYQPAFKNDHTLVFESRFESGNLRRAIQVYEFEYDLILKPDYNTRGFTQWYYFRLSNTCAGRTYRFNIINLLKPDSLYNHGMRPLMYSEIEAKTNGKGWVRAGRDVCYYQNSMKRKTAGHYYTLTFSVNFSHDNDTIYFAHSYPYTYSDLQRYLNKIEEDPKKKQRMKRRELCRTIAGNICDLLIVTTFGSDYEEVKKRKGIVISSRVHPGETGSSFMMKGIIDYLVGPSMGARMLRDNFVIKIIPMVNPDGVINGNTRCSLSGFDLNRVWIDPNPKQHPTVFHIKGLIKQMQAERELFLFCDLHGHSRKKNMFMYGNCNKNDTHVKEKIFPFLLEKAADIFNFGDCAFAVQKSKESTARVVGWKELGIMNCYTLESTFCGSDFGKYQDLHFNTNMLQSIGPKFCETILEYNFLDTTRQKAILEEIEESANQIKEQPQANLMMGMGGLIEDEAAAGLHQVDANAGLLGIIKDEESCQDSDFSGDEKETNGAAGQDAEIPTQAAASSGQPNSVAQKKAGGAGSAANQSSTVTGGKGDKDKSGATTGPSASSATDKGNQAATQKQGNQKKGQKDSGVGGPVKKKKVKQ